LQLCIKHSSAVSSIFMNKKAKSILFCIIAIVILVISQVLSQVIGSVFYEAGIPLLEPIIGAILYPLFTYFGLKIAAQKMMKSSLSSLRIDRPKLKWYWVLAAVLLPIFVVLVFWIFGGTISVLQTSVSNKILVAVSGIAYYSIAAGIVEEMVFRGAIMGMLEKEFNLKAAIFVTSVLFGCVHLIGNSLPFGSAVQLIVAGTFVGIMFSLVEYESGNFWNNAIIHALWNMSTSGLFHIGTDAYEYSLFTLIVSSKSNFITGGDFGVEASFISILGYVIISVIAVILIRSHTKGHMSQ